MITRRRFLQVGLAGAALLAAARLLERPHPLAPYRALDASQAAIMGALAPVVLAGALPPQEPARSRALREVLAAFDAELEHLSPAGREEIGKLLALLRFGPSRIALTGVRTPLERASSQEIAGFLARWRASRFDFARAGYLALTQLLQAAWYDNPASWPATGYPGPPRLDAHAAS